MNLSTNLSAIDVNLVVALDALLRERSVTRAAGRVGLSQPAMSHALTRLRELLHDPLLVRTGRQMVLTPRAEALSGQVGAVIQDLEALFGGSAPPFDAAASSRAFRVAASEYVQLVLLPQLHALAAREAPRVTLHVSPLDAITVAYGLRSGALDLALGAFPPDAVPSGVRRAELFRDPFVGLAKSNHPKARGSIDAETYAALTHVAISPADDQGACADDLLVRRGAPRRIAMTVPQFLVAPHVVASSELVVILSNRAATALQSVLAVRTFEPPIDLPPREIAMLWHGRAHDDPASKWLRRVVADASKEVRSIGRRKPDPTR